MTRKPILDRVKIGPAGWSYADWKGIVYPADAGSRFDQLAFIADFFDTIEINSSFYRPPSPNAAASWIKRVKHNTSFKFTAKLHRAFTHERRTPTPEDEHAFREGIDPLAQAGKLGALLIQFPWSFKNTGENAEYLSSLLDRFAQYPLVLEVRHSSWNEPRVYESLERRDVGFCNIDQPLFSKSIKPSARSTSRVGYVRLHGRNYHTWFTENKSTADRYNYLYSIDELQPWIANIRSVAEDSEETYVIANNHFRGKAVVNALEIKAQLAERKVTGPPSLIVEYPRLKESVITDPRLF